MALNLTTATEPLAAALEALVPQLAPLAEAFATLTASLQRAVGQMERFAEALSPATIAVFERTVRNLEATLGQAVVPVFQVLASTVERFAGIISPLAAQLAPIFEQVALAFSGPLLNLARVFSEAFQGLQPAFQAFGQLIGSTVKAVAPWFEVLVNALAQPIAMLGALAEVMSVLLVPTRVFGEVFSVLTGAVSFAFQTLSLALLPLTMVVEAISEAMGEMHDITRATQLVFAAMYDTLKEVVVAALAPFGSGLRSATDMIKQAFVTAAQQIILFSARVAAAFGAMGYIDALIKKINAEGREVGLVAAPQNVQIQDVAGIARSMAIAAFAAGPTGGDKNEKDYLRDILPILQDIQKNPADFKRSMEEKLDEVIRAIKAQLGDTFSPDKIGPIIANAIVAGLRNRPFG
jgi:hypothetical protein